MATPGDIRLDLRALELGRRSVALELRLISRGT